MTALPLPTGSNTGPAFVAAGGDLVNCFAERREDPTNGPFCIRALHGLSTFADDIETACRGLHYVEADDLVIAAHGDVLVTIASDGTVTEIGALPGTGPVQFARNQATTYELVIYTEAGLYVYSSGELTALVNSELTTCNGVAYLKGRVIYTRPDGRFYWSALLDAKSVDPLAFATAEIKSDRLLRAWVTRNELWLFGTETVEIWATGLSADLPYANVSAAHYDVGLANAKAVAEFDNAPTWVDNRGRVVRADAGFVARRISNHEVERDIAKVDRAGIEALSYTYDGHEFFVISCPSWTWAFDAASQEWHRRESAGLTRWRCNSVVSAWGQTLFGDVSSGSIYTMDAAARTEGGARLTCKARFAPFKRFPAKFIVDRLAVEMETGKGLISGLGSDPMVMLRVSGDAGATWVNFPTRSVGKMGAYSQAVEWHRMGRFTERGMTIELAVSDPVDYVLTAVDAAVRPLA